MRYFAFETGKGWLVYSPNDGKISHTLDPMQATDAKLEDWLGVAWFDLERCTLFSKQSHKLDIPPCA